MDQSGKGSGWANPIDQLEVEDLPEGAINLNVEGRQLTGLLRGFGQMWQKTYRVRLSGVDVNPQDLIATWKKRFPEFWPEGNELFVPLTGINPGEVGVINLTAPGGMKLSTGIMVIHADEDSFAFMTPEGHMFAGMITFSSYEDEGAAVAEIQALIRANDPIYELGCRLGIVHAVEDDFWQGTLGQLAKHYGIDNPQVTQTNRLVDPKVQWDEVSNIWKNAGIRTALYMPVIIFKQLLARLTSN
jgi:hypothetical protein